MMNNDISIETFLEKLGSGAPTPGGGAAAALTSALGASLIMMVTNNTIEKKKCLEFKDLQVNSRSEAHMIKERLTGCIEKDARAYAKVAAAYRIPRSIAKFETISDIRTRLTDLDTDLDLSDHLKRLDYALSVRGRTDKITDLPEDLVQLLDVSYKATRDELLAHASIEASKVPLSVMEDSLAGMKIADDLTSPLRATFSLRSAASIQAYSHQKPSFRQTGRRSSRWIHPLLTKCVSAQKR